MSATVESPSWRTVEVGRLVLVNNGPFTGRIAAIVEIISEKRVSVARRLEKSGSESRQGVGS
jgi:large subunit ribosomal protein L14e